MNILWCTNYSSVRTNTRFTVITIGSLMKVESIAERSPWNILLTCILKAIIALENQFSVFLRVAVLHRVYCIHVRFDFPSCPVHSFGTATLSIVVSLKPFELLTHLFCLSFCTHTHGFNCVITLFLLQKYADMLVIWGYAFERE